MGRLGSRGMRTCARWSSAAAVVVSLVAGCVAGTAALRDISAGRIGCPPDRIRIVNDRFGGGTRTWVAECDGRSYQCSAFASGPGSDVACALDEAPRASPTPPRSATSGTRSLPPSDPRQTGATHVFASATNAVLACFPGAQRIELALLIAPQGNVYDFRGPRQLTADERRCVGRALSSLRAPSSSAAIRRARARFPDEQPTTPDSPTAADASVPATDGFLSVDAGGPADHATRLRTWLDGQRDAILACTQRTNVVVTARWDATGTVTVALVGDLAGTPAEGCVRSAVGAQHVTAGAAGEVRHLVR